MLVNLVIHATIACITKVQNHVKSGEEPLLNFSIVCPLNLCTYAWNDFATTIRSEIALFNSALFGDLLCY